MARLELAFYLNGAAQLACKDRCLRSTAATVPVHSGQKARHTAEKTVNKKKSKPSGWLSPLTRRVKAGRTLREFRKFPAGYKLKIFDKI